jgi:hypothetical protein
MIKVVITTSDAYHHILPIFFKLYVREWNWPCELVGYKKPDMELPECCTWVSLGEQRGPKYFSDDLRPYFKKQDQYFVWLFEDSFIKSVDKERLEWLKDKCGNVWQFQPIGRICLSREGMNRPHVVNGEWWFADPKSLYRLSTQPSIWKRDFLLQYLTPGLTPWAFEKQETVDDWAIMGPITSIVSHNEGVTKKDIHKLNLEGIVL